jgi:hypothetical protein
MPSGISAKPVKRITGRIRKTMIPMYGLSTWPRIWRGKTKSHDIPAVVTSAVPTRINGWRVNKNQIGLLLGEFIVFVVQNTPSEVRGV